MSVLDSAIKDLVQAFKEFNKNKTSPYDTQAEVKRVEGNIAWVHIPGGVDETPVKLTMNAQVGDVVQARIAGGHAWLTGNVTNPPTDDKVANQAMGAAILAQQEVLTVKEVVAESIKAIKAQFEYVEADTAKIHDLEADEIHAGITYTNELIADGITAENIIADHATIGSLDANYAHITNGVIDNASIDYADVENLDAHYAEIDLANVNNAWIQNGVVKDAAITDAKILGVSANKLTAGTIDASNITVTNLNADNITAGTLNGQRIGTGSLSLDKLSEEVPTKDYVDNVAENLQGQIDGQIETWTGTVVPTLNNSPASAWTTADERHKHVGDIYYVVNAGATADGYTYRFTESGTTTKTYSWTLIKDNQITKALQDILDIQGDISDIQTFDSQISSWKTDTNSELSSLKSRTSTLETGMGNKVDTSTFNQLSQTVDENSANITSLTTTVSNKADSSTVTTLSNTINTVSQKADSNSSKITSLTQTLGTNADGTTKTGDIVHQVSQIDQDLDGVTTRVSKTEVKLAGQYATSSTGAGTTAKVATITPAVTGWTLYTGATVTVKFSTANTATTPTLNVNSTGAKTIKGYKGAALTEKEYKWVANDVITFIYDGTNWLMQSSSTEATRLSTAEASIAINAGNIELKANASDVYTKTAANALLEVKANKDTLTSEINASADTVKINANKVNITGVITAINDDTTTTINGGKITTGSITANQIAANSIAIGKLDASTRNSISDAAQTATSYITDIDAKNGIILKAINGATSGSDATKQNYIKLNADGLDVYKGGASVAQYGDSARVGKTSAGHVVTASDGIELWGDPQYGNDHTFIYSSGVRIGVNSESGAVGLGPGGNINGYYNEINDNVTEKGITIEANTVGGDDEPASTQTYIGIWANGSEKSAGVTVDVNDNEDFDEYEVGTTSVRLLGDKVSINDDPIVDFVIEQGISGIWTYRKWSSGIAECWGYYEKTVSIAGNGHTAMNLPAMPTLFTTSPVVTVSGGGTANPAIFASYTRAYSATGLDIYLHNLSGTALNNTGWINVYCIGKWK